MPILFSGWGEKSLERNEHLGHYLGQYGTAPYFFSFCTVKNP